MSETQLTAAGAVLLRAFTSAGFFSFTASHLLSLCYQACVMEVELLDPSQLLLRAQRQCGVKDVHLTLCPVHDVLLKLCMHTNRVTARCTHSIDFVLSLSSPTTLALLTLKQEWSCRSRCSGRKAHACGFMKSLTAFIQIVCMYTGPCLRS